jgi:hypothetical protein
VRKLTMCLAALLGFAAVVQAAGPERWLHVRVVDGGEGETVNVNVPLSMAEKVLPAINEHNFHNGKVNVGDMHMEDVNLPMLLEAIRTAPDNEFVTVQGKGEDVRVAKQRGNLVIHVMEPGKDGEHVDISVPMRVVSAMVAQGANELDLNAVVRELEQLGDTTLVTVEEASQSVHIWIDSRNSAD